MLSLRPYADAAISLAVLFIAVLRILVEAGLGVLSYPAALAISAPVVFLAPRLKPFLEAIRRRLPAMLEVDNRGAGFLLGVVFVFAVASAAGLHGSSSSIIAAYGLPENPAPPLLGGGRGIRVDEWGSHTPVILYQAHRADAFAVEGATGPYQSILVANAPVRHWTAVFRPQFWAFFCLTPAQAFAVYWQCKTLLLLTGVFLVLQLLTKSSGLAILGALWFYWSAFTQWAFSWPALLPEMIGLACWAVVLTALLFSATRRAWLWAALLVAVCLNFLLCAYPPFQIPLIYAAVALWLAWWSGGAPEGSWRRVALAFAVACVVALAFAWETRDLAELIASTVYPGKRSVPGGTISWTLLASGFANIFMSEGHYPAGFGNICIAASYYWLSPLALVALWFTDSRTRRSLLICVGFLALLTAWMVLPVPASAGRFLLLDKVQPERVVPAAGLLNTAIVILLLQATMRGERKRRGWVAMVALAAAFLLMLGVNSRTGGFLSSVELAFCAVLLGASATALLLGVPRVFGALVLAPALWAFLLVNPVDRGLKAYERTSFEKTVRDRGLNQGLWLVFAKDTVVAPYLSAMGLDVFNAFNYAPFLERWRRFDPERRYDSFYNGSGAALAYCLPPGSPSRMEPLPGLPVMPPLLREFHVDASDPRLREAGVRYIAYQGPANPVCFPESRFELVYPQPLNGLSIYTYK